MNSEVSERCNQCPLFLRVTESCPRNPQFLFYQFFMEDEYDILTVLYENAMIFVSVICQFIFIGHFLLFIKLRHRGILRVCAMSFFQKLLGEILKRAYEEPRPKEACLFNNAASMGNPSELSAVASAFFVGYLLYSSRIYLHYNSQDQVLFGIMQGIVITITAFMFIIGPSQDTILAEYFADFDERNQMSEKSTKLMQDLCTKLGVDPKLDASTKAQEIIKKMESLESLKNSLNVENKGAQERMTKLEQQVKIRDEQQRQLENIMNNMSNPLGGGNGGSLINRGQNGTAQNGNKHDAY
ncbi:UNKNOWN [Stylonychia lemnae]|uniref:Uncharacterized protein n=1 Tax=Stylonychia lemnae TaxID=5949 RepID=A0A078A8Q3_STYLE|nr:UNKNOWN [Stylonychia lemnae]|eukprot:CDW78261.1 UNKNOWN [Stylonychia lemnae]